MKHLNESRLEKVILPTRVQNHELRGNDKAYYIKPDNTIDELDSKREYNLNELQEMVGGYIEVVYNLPDNKIMIVNEDGKLEGESFNFFATNLALYNRSIATDDCIVGNAVVLNSRQLK